MGLEVSKICLEITLEPENYLVFKLWYKDVGYSVYICFIEFENAFHGVKHTEMILGLQQVGIDDEDIRIIENLYWHQSEIIKTLPNDQTTQR